MRKIIFLDVDGVLNSLPYAERVRNTVDDEEINEENVKRLKQIYDATNAEIIISSTWRDCDIPNNKSVYFMWQYLESKLRKYGMRISGKTPQLGNNRPYEISEWLRENTEREEVRFVSLDDDFIEDEYEEYGIGNCLIRTYFFCLSEDEGGLQQEHVDMAIRKLNGDMD